MANLITSLRLIATFDWSEFFESVSLVEQVLQRDPAGVYGRMDFRSRDRYRHAVEELAAPTGEAQLLLALKSVERARQVHVGPGRAGGARRLPPDWRRAAEFERSIAWRPDLRQRIDAVVLRWATPGYLGTIAAGTARARWWPWPMRGSTAGAAPVWSSSRSDRRPGQRADDSVLQRLISFLDSAAAAAAHRARPPCRDRRARWSSCRRSSTASSASRI